MFDDTGESDVIDLTSERNKREQPDSDCVRRDDYGRPLYLFGLQYDMPSPEAVAGGTWGIDLWAYSRVDAHARVAAMRETLTLVGQVHARIPA